MKTKLDPLEQAIEENAPAYKPVAQKKLRAIEAIIDEARKTKNINIRISEHDLEMLKRKSSEEGIPYQTLLASIIHKYVSNRLVDEKDIMKSVQLLARSST